MNHSSNDSIYCELRARLSAATTLQKNEPLAKRTTFRIGGPADLFVEPGSEADLAEVYRFCRERRISTFVLGRGSNLLVRDGGIRGVVIALASPAFSQIEVVGQTILTGAGVRSKDVALTACKNGLRGLEFLEGIPGSMGGALRMNAGAMGRATFDAVRSVRFMDNEGNTYQRDRSELEVKYRCCPVLKTNIAISAVLEGDSDAPDKIALRMKEYSQKRWTSQPKEPSAGCVFKNPDGFSAGKLIDELGLKNTRVGGAVVSPVHGNFIVNAGNATAADVTELVGLIQAKVRMLKGIELQTELEIVGEEIKC